MAEGQKFLQIALSVAFCLQFVVGETLVDCYVTSVKVPDSNVAGGVGIDNATDFASCEAICTGSSSCYGFDWDRRQNRCFLTEDTSADINFNNSPGVDHYILLKGPNNCDDSCSYPFWDPIVNAHTSEADGQSVSSLDQCILRCIQISSCTSIDWDPENPNGLNCWIQRKSSFYVEADNVYHYAKNCSPIVESSKTPSARTTTLPLPISSNRPVTTTLPQPLGNSITTTATSSSSSSLSSTSTIKTSTDVQRIIPSGSMVTFSSTKPTILSTAGSASTTAKTLDITTENATGSSTSSISSNATIQDSTWNNTEEDIYEYKYWLIKPTYVILTGLGGGCLLLVLIAVVILCQYSLNSSMNENFHYQTDTVDSSDNINMSFFDHQSNTDFPIVGVVAPEFEPTNRR